MDQTPSGITQVLIAGAGTMGIQIALQCAAHGVEVRLHDTQQEALDRAMDAVRRRAPELVAAGVLAEGQVDAAIARIGADAGLSSAADADLVIECVPEDRMLKRHVFSDLNERCPGTTIFATNTSTFVPSMLADATGRPDRFAALHFHSTVWISNVADVMGHPGTSPETLATLEAFARAIGQVPIVLEREHAGYVFNAMLSAVNREALTLVANRFSTVEDVDRSWMGVMKMPIGPFGILDGVGLDTALHITQFWANALNDPQLRANAELLRTYVDRGDLGVKTGRGFYEYPDPAFAAPGFVEGAPRSGCA
ncbi:MAG TPA: 3-hydroxyacyl-CoA dehydrogenase [Actinomycetota bacterium]|nr:3-hydroxyacyl-CoA dehydrogenase [Actinomycetota bacterium]